MYAAAEKTEAKKPPVSYGSVGQRAPGVRPEDAWQVELQRKVNRAAAKKNKHGAATARSEIIADGESAISFTISCPYDKNGNTTVTSDSSLTDQDTTRFILEDSCLGGQGTASGLHQNWDADSNPALNKDDDGHSAWSTIQPTFYAETDIFGSTPVRDTGNQYIDKAWAGLDIALAAPKYVINAASAIASIPTIGYAKTRGISVQEADEEIAGYMASAGPLAPYLLTGAVPFRLGSTLGYSARVLRAETKAVRKTAAKITKELKSSSIETAYEAVEAVAQKIGTKQYIISSKGADPKFIRIKKSDVGDALSEIRNYNVSVKDMFKNNVAKIRTSLPKNIKRSGNVGVAKVEIKGLPKTFKAHSRLNYSVDKGAEGFSLLKNKNERIFQPKNVDIDNVRVNTPNSYSRQYDTEFKILEDIASRLGKNKNVSGTIDLFTERAACASCSDIIMEFRQKFPNIKLNVYTGN